MEKEKKDRETPIRLKAEWLGCNTHVRSCPIVILGVPPGLERDWISNIDDPRFGRYQILGRVKITEFTLVGS